MKYIKPQRDITYHINAVLNDKFISEFKENEGDDLSTEDINHFTEEYISLLKKNIKGDSITLYRKIHLSNIEDLDRENVGPYWSFSDNPNSYHFYGDGEGSEFVLRADFRLVDIDWYQSLYKWLLFVNIERENEVLVDEITFDKLYYSENGGEYQKLEGDFNI